MLCRNCIDDTIGVSMMGIENIKNFIKNPYRGDLGVDVLAPTMITINGLHSILWQQCC